MEIITLGKKWRDLSSKSELIANRESINGSQYTIRKRVHDDLPLLYRRFVCMTSQLCQ